jgi:cobalamin biosynthesis Co2+ chelatase CbiK
MFQRQQATVTVSGATVEENQQIASLIRECLAEKGFTNVSAANVETSPYRDTTVYDMIRSMNPDLLDTPVHLVADSEEELSGSRMTAPVLPNYPYHQPHWHN